jgi:hypothetical protein
VIDWFLVHGFATEAKIKAFLNSPFGHKTDINLEALIYFFKIAMLLQNAF